MAIKKDQLDEMMSEKNGMRVRDNMDGEKRANEKLNMEVADVSNKMSLKNINEYIRRYKSGESVIDILPKNLTKKELQQLQNLAKKRY